MKLLLPLLCGLVVLEPAFAADAPVGETEQFVSHCRLATSVKDSVVPTPDRAMEIGFCLGLMDGVRGTNFFLKKAKSEAAFCEPEQLKNDDLARAFIRSVEQHPDLASLRGSLGVLVALRAAFPCPKPKS